MTLNEAKTLLSKNSIPYELCEYQNETAYWHHAMQFPHTKNAKSCKVTVILIRSKNGKKNMELQFHAVDGIFRFAELYFGDYSYEMFDVKEESLENDLLACIAEIINGRFTVICASDLRKKRRLGDACFDRGDDDKRFGEPGFQKAMQRIQKPKGIFEKVSKSVKQYEIYDWNTYQCIIK